MSPVRPNLDLDVIGNCEVSALIDDLGRIVWMCLPRPDGDPVFSALLTTEGGASPEGVFAVDMVDLASTEQRYRRNTAVVETILHDAHGGSLLIRDFCPRYRARGRMFRPMMLVRIVEPIAGRPVVRIRLRPTRNFGAEAVCGRAGSHHLVFPVNDLEYRVTTDASLSALADQCPIVVDQPLTFVLGPNQTIEETPSVLAHSLLLETSNYWQDWVRTLAIPFDWQEEVIRAAITLKLNAFDDTGAIVAAMTTSVPEAADSGRNWDYRYCWLRDGYFVVNALNRLGATATMERYLRYLVGIAAAASDGPIQPVYRISGSGELPERVEPALPGYRGMGPVRVGNDAWRQVQHDVYGAAVLAATHVFFDARLTHGGDAALFARLEALGARAVAAHDQPDAGLWELRGSARVHTFSSVMCWAACDRLARIADRLGLPARAAHWRDEAGRIRAFVDAHGWSAELGTFVATAGGRELDASLLLLTEFNFVAADDPRYVATVNAIERDLMRGGFLFRYVEADDFGAPRNAFVVCSFWLVDALAAIGRRDDARALFERLLACRNAHGLLAEHIDPATGEAWGNFVQTYSMVGLINSAIRLSIPWDEAF